MLRLRKKTISCPEAYVSHSAVGRFAKSSRLPRHSGPQQPQKFMQGGFNFTQFAGPGKKPIRVGLFSHPIPEFSRGRDRPQPLLREHQHGSRHVDRRCHQDVPVILDDPLNELGLLPGVLGLAFEHQVIRATAAMVSASGTGSNTAPPERSNLLPGNSR